MAAALVAATSFGPQSRGLAEPVEPSTTEVPGVGESQTPSGPEPVVTGLIVGRTSLLGLDDEHAIDLLVDHDVHRPTHLGGDLYRVELDRSVSVSEAELIWVRLS